jgi:tetratricopeptide (TPR) repeat protein
MYTKGFSATEAVETLARAQVLAEQLDRSEHLVPLMVGQWGVHGARAEHRPALSLGEQVEGTGKVRNDIAMQVFGRLMQGISRLHLGELVAACALLKEHADPEHPPTDARRAHFHALRLASTGHALVLLGRIDQGRFRMGEAVSLARRIRRSSSLAQMLTYASVVHHNTGSHLIHAEELLALSTEQKFDQWLAWALAFRGLALTGSGQAQEAFVLFTQALAQLRAIRVGSGVPLLLAWLADAAAKLGQPAEAWRYFADAARMVGATDERVSEAEVLHRMPGDLLKATGDQSGAEQHYRQAIVIAERQSAKLLQLQASTSLARLWRDQSKRVEARDLLAPIYGWFTEGFDAPVLKEAKALLDELA